ncbi:MAG: dicarboxylate/amino acid:cation symporter [Oligoflexia bacterium]|nr:dicarboxylate/amino acid:cation symporter [Oligoflexia bacterium]MBF0364922.1 dicarboxylate/amino acid:cation symporter [Oligoflexia bacterium]
MRIFNVKISLTTWIFIGLFAGLLFGYFAPPEWAMALKPIGKLFIRLIKMIVAPLVFASLVVGLAGAGKGHVGRLLLKSLLWFWLATSVALVIGLAAANIVKPGIGASNGKSTQGITATITTAAAPTPEQKKPIYEQVVPDSIFRALSENSILQIVFFAMLFGMALASMREEEARPVVTFLNTVMEAMFKVTNYVMVFAPIGVGAAMASAIGHHGIGVLVNLGKLVLSLYGALIICAILLIVAAKIIFKIHLTIFLKELKDALILAFSTTSSESALPLAMKSMVRLGVPAPIVGFVIPAGYSFNLVGTTLYLSLASLFIAQAAGIHLSASQQLSMMLMLIITSKGVAAVPRASLVVLSATCTEFGLPIEWVATILGVDEVMDMARTTINVFGNCLASAVIAKWEGVLPDDAPIITGILPPEDINKEF